MNNTDKHVILLPPKALVRNALIGEENSLLSKMGGGGWGITEKRQYK